MLLQPSTVASIALGICLAGLLWRIGRWFRSDIGPESLGLPPGRRAAAAGQALLGLLPSRRLFKVAGAFLWEVLLLGHLLRRHPLRWAAHMVICYGFLLLVLFHALDDWITPHVWADYEPTLNPFRGLRNLLAALVLAGILAGVMRRRRQQHGRGALRSAADRILILLVAVIIVSGVLLESAQLVSPAVFQEMVEDYMGDDDPDEVTALHAYWAAKFGAWEPPPGPGPTDDQLAAGQAAHQAYCAACHDRPQSAFLSYPASRLLKPALAAAGDRRIDLWLWNLHFWAACLALAGLPFSKAFHVVATPLSLLARAAGPALSPPALQPPRRALGLDACTHCGVCSEHCAVAPIGRVIPNPTILPSEKLLAVKHLRPSDAAAASRLAEGSFICTLCGRCTQWCPSGILLQDLWQATRHDLAPNGRGPQGRGWPPSPPRDLAEGAALSLGLTDRPETFWACVQCTTCTNVCPVVAASDDPQQELDLTPQQIMNLMRLQLKDQALGSRMLWACVTCYKCQEHCPQDVKVADILYELRNAAWRRQMPAGGRN